MQTERINPVTDLLETKDESFDAHEDLMRAIERNMQDEYVERFTVTMNRHERRRQEKIERLNPKPRRGVKQQER